MMVRTLKRYVVTSSIAMLFFSYSSNADIWTPSIKQYPKHYAQLMLGSQSLDESWYVLDNEGDYYVADVEAVRYLGFAVQRVHQLNSALEYGFEGAVQVGYDSHRKLFIRLGSETSMVDIDSSLWTGDFSAGTVFGFKPAPWLRLFVAAGPSVYWGQLSHGDSADGERDGRDTTSGRIVIDTRSDDYHIGVAFYSRAGVEFIFDNGFVLGASVRQLNAQLNFDRNGSIDIDQPHYSLIIGSYF